MSTEASETLAPVQAGAIDEEHLTRSVFRLAWPVVVQQVSFSMVQLVDTFLVGHLGEDALAGVRLAGQIFWFSQAGMVAVGVGATAVVARNVGAGQPERASVTLRNAMLMAVAWGSVMGLLMWFLGGWGLGMMGAEAGAKHQGTVYLKAAALGLPLTAVVYAGSASLQGAGDTRAPMLIGIVVNIVNIVVAYSLINGPGPFPRLNVLGSGAGFTSAAIVGSLLVLGVLASGRRIVRWSPWQAARVSARESRRILNVGVPSGLEQLQFNIAFMLYTRIIASLGTAALAAHGVTLAIQGLTFNVGFALSVATTALVGQSLGARRPDLAERAVFVAVRSSLVVMVAIGVTLMLFGGQITNLFVGGENAAEVVSIGRKLLFIFAFAMPALAVSLCLG
ncbi:MAG TPA: MATE family efflux transporter, partial [Dehalococcoidia bacterium]|nr:MATE family efflux transporter [Dehalococcoidia bacterium]